MNREELTRFIGFNIRKFRLQQELSQEALALSAGVHPAYLGRLERGEKCPTIDTLYKICDALNVSVCELLTFKEIATDMDNPAKQRIEIALTKLPVSKHIKVAEIVENIVDFLSE